MPSVYSRFLSFILLSFAALSFSASALDESYQIYTKNGEYYIKSDPTWVPISGSVFVIIPIYEEGEVLKLINSGGSWQVQNITYSQFTAANPTLVTNGSVSYSDLNSDGITDIALNLGSASGGQLIELRGSSTPGTFVAYEPPSGWNSKGGTVANVSLPSVSVPSSNFKGATAGQGGVSGGAASYQIPISVVPGRAGMQPNISISYSSRSGSGVVGVGWNLNAGGAISRCPSTVAQDGRVGGVTMNTATDKLCLNGQRLIRASQSSIYGNLNVEYKLELDDNTIVKQKGGNLDSAASYFEVTYADGSKEFYGNDTDARVIPLGSGKPLSWNITKKQDVSGNNTMKYTYAAPYDNEFLLTRIDYTGTATTTGNRSVVFNYNYLAKPSTRYIDGGKLRSTRRLNFIRTMYNGVRAREYKFAYKTSGASGRSLLKTVTECMQFGTGSMDCRKPLTLDWSDNPVQMKVERLVTQQGNEIIDMGVGGEILKHIPQGDMDGNGVRDWPNMHVDAELNKIRNNTADIQQCRRNSLTYQLQCVNGDFNNDGRTDSWRVGNERLQIGISNGSSFSWSGSTDIVLRDDTNSWGVKYDTIANIADYNGDGWPDIVVHQATQSISPRTGHQSVGGDLYVYHHTGNMSNPYTNSRKRHLYSLQSDESVQYTGDMDNDGLPDFAISKRLRNNSLTRITDFLFSSVDQYDNLSVTRVPFYLPATEYLYDDFGMLVDINSDGLPDWVGIIPGQQMKLYVKINEGDRSFKGHSYLGYSLSSRELTMPDRVSNEPDGLNSPKFVNAIKQVDLNGDGRTELIIPHTRVISRCTRVEISGGSRPYRCGDDIYQPYTHGNFLRSQSTEYDNSTYQYRSLTFKETSVGAGESYAIQYATSPVIATAESSFAIDGFGKGLADIVFFNGCNTSQCRLASSNNTAYQENKAYFVRNYGAATSSNPGDDDYRAIDLLESVDNDLGIRSEWEYHPLTSSQPTDFYTVNHASVSDSDHFLFASSMYAVSSFKQSNGIGNQMNERQYRYENAMYNNQGRGFRGFESIVEIDVANQIRTETDFKQRFPFSSLIKEQRVYSIADDNNNPFQTVENTWVQSSTHRIFNTGMYKVHNERSETNRYSLTDTTNRLSRSVTSVVQSYVDRYGNIHRAVTQVTDGSGGEGFGTYTTTETKAFAASASWPNKLTSSTVSKVYAPSANVPTKHSSTGLNKTVTTKIDSWNTTHRKPARITVASGSSAKTQSQCNTLSLTGCTTTVTVYNTYGLPTSVAVTGARITGTNDQVSNETRTTTTTYTSDGYFPSSVSVSSGTHTHTQSVVTDAKSGAPTKTTDANGLTVDTVYDSFLRPIEITAQGVPKQYIRYRTPDGNSPNGDDVMMISTYQAGAPETHEYKDSLGRTLRTKTQNFDGGLIYADIRYDGLGRTTHESAPHTGSAVYTVYSQFDALGRPGRKVTPATESGEDVTTYYTYNGLTTDISTSAPDGYNLSLSRTHNSMGQLMKTVDAKNGVTQYSYDAAGNPIVIKDAAGNSIYANYDNLGRKTWVRDPNQGLTSFVYNDFGELEKETDANNETMRYELDRMGRLKKRYSPDGNADFVWDTRKKGLLTSESAPNVSKNYYYDSLARPYQVDTRIDGTLYRVKTEYDANFGRPKAIEYPNQLKVALQYNSRGYLTHEKNAASGYVYREVTAMDAFGNIKSANLSNTNLTGNYLYSARTGQMLNSRVLNGSSTIHYLDYEDYDSYGNIVSQSNLVSGINSTDDFVYDQLHRMTQSRTTGGAGSGTISATIDYKYDAVGNMKSKSDYSTTSSSAYSYQSGTNRLMSVALKGGGSATFGYDAKGNQTHRNGRSEVVYNAFNKPTSINRLGSQVSLYYDANWSRYKQVRTVSGKTITTHYIDKMYEVEIDGSKTKKSSYISDVAILIEDQNGPKIRYTHKDRLGSSATFTDHRGEVTAYRSYDPFGKPKMGNGSLMSSFASASRLTNNLLDTDQATRRGFTDHEHLDEVEIIHLNGRVYDYNVGRFMSVDPFIQAPGNSQSVNPYSYIMNNPLWGTDPSGYCSASRINAAKGSVCGGGSGSQVIEDHNRANQQQRMVNQINGIVNGSDRSQRDGNSFEMELATELKELGQTASNSNHNSSSTTYNNDVNAQVKDIENLNYLFDRAEIDSDPYSGNWWQLGPALTGANIHSLYSEYVTTVLGQVANLSLGIFEGRPDSVDLAAGTLFELKPMTWSSGPNRNKAKVQIADYIMSAWENDFVHLRAGDSGIITQGRDSITIGRTLDHNKNLIEVTLHRDPIRNSGLVFYTYVTIRNHRREMEKGFKQLSDSILKVAPYLPVGPKARPIK